MRNIPGYRILYIEDDEQLCDLFKVAIEAHGHSVDVVLNGEVSWSHIVGQFDS